MSELSNEEIAERIRALSEKWVSGDTRLRSIVLGALIEKDAKLARAERDETKNLALAKVAVDENDRLQARVEALEWVVRDYLNFSIPARGCGDLHEKARAVLEGKDVKSSEDDPSLDGTPNEHPAYRRGDDHGFRVGLAKLRAYARHLSNCRHSGSHPTENDDCSCGLIDILRAWQ